MENSAVLNEYNSRRTGSEYETAACDYLKNCGYDILARNYRVSAGEIDIVAQSDGYIVFVEVKFRSNTHMGAASEAVDYRKQKRISKAALYFLKQYGYGVEVPVRFDVITVSGNEITHIENAYDYAGW